MCVCSWQVWVQQQHSSKPAAGYVSVHAAGAVSLCSVMHMLQEAHAALHTTQPQPPPQPLQQPQPQQARTRMQRRHAQQALSAAAPSTHHTGWAHLAAVQAAAESKQRRSWLARQRAALSAYTHKPLQRLAQLSAPPAAAAAAAGSVAGAGPQQETTAAAPTGPQAVQLLPGSQPDLLQWCVQHLLGLLVALNLLLHWQLVLDAAAAAGAWLQYDVLQPHIDWLAQAHPGELLPDTHTPQLCCCTPFKQSGCGRKCLCAVTTHPFKMCCLYVGLRWCAA